MSIEGFNGEENYYPAETSNKHKGDVMRELPEKIHDKVYQWLGVYDLLHFWKQDETFLIVAKVGDGFYFLRLFPLGAEYTLSQDAVFTT